MSAPVALAVRLGGVVKTNFNGFVVGRPPVEGAHRLPGHGRRVIIGAGDEEGPAAGIELGKPLPPLGDADRGEIGRCHAPGNRCVVDRDDFREVSRRGMTDGHLTELQQKCR
jgi:hypothetical protein